MEPKDLGFIRAGKVRSCVYDMLYEPLTVSQIAESVMIEQSQVSRAVKELCERGVVRILNPEARKGRLYQNVGRPKVGEEIMAENPFDDEDENPIIASMKRNKGLMDRLSKM
jgi:predicted transcriptional regulator